MRYVFGPVLSRRLGRSLGIDPVPFKTCNWNCVYCQLGRTTPVTNDRCEYVPAAEVVEEVSQALRAHHAGEIDWLTFLGSGEPTLHANLGWMISQVKRLSHVPVAVITNGSLLYRPEVRDELLDADAVLPSLDAGTAPLYRAINRPFPGCTFERLVDGLIAFRRCFAGKLWIEVMLVKGLNDTEAAWSTLATVLTRIAPDEVHISSPVRPPAEPWVQVPSPEDLARAASILGGAARPVRSVAGEFDLSGYENVVDAIVAVISRHPMAEEELMRALDRWTPGEVGRGLARLADNQRAQVVSRHGQRFWSSSEARYAGEPKRAV
jgi:wyosine [tRNA(Phe)-imidazoG37] synthetase (radical SAM superfamily)